MHRLRPTVRDFLKAISIAGGAFIGVIFLTAACACEPFMLIRSFSWEFVTMNVPVVAILFSLMLFLLGDLVYSEKDVTRIFEPISADIRYEWMQALAKEQRLRAVGILIIGCWSFLNASILCPVYKLLKLLHVSEAGQKHGGAPK